MHAQAFHSCEVRKYFTHPSSLVKSSSSCFFSICLLFSERFILWLHLMDSGWFLNQWSQNKLQNITQSRRRTNKESQPRILLLCPVSLELFFFNVFLVLTETPWRKLNSAPVCFGARDNQFGRFRVEVGGSIQAVKLVHVSGEVTCNYPWNAYSKWGCDRPNLKQYIFVLLTNTSNTILLPMGQSQGSRYTLPGYDAQSSEIIFSGFPNPLHLSSDKELRLWYAEDLRDHTEDNNNGTSCTDVFAKYL